MQQSWIMIIENTRKHILTTLPETNVTPENWWLEDVFPFEIEPFQVLC